MKVCFFSHENETLLKQEQYSIQDINILKDLGCSVTIATTFAEIPWDSDLYFSWWASGSIFPLIKAWIANKPIIVVAGGNEAVFYRDSVCNTPRGYLAYPLYKKLATRLSLRYGNVVIVVSRYMVKDVMNLGASNPIVVYNSVNTNLFSPSCETRSYVTTMFRSDDDVIKIKRGEVFLRAIPFVLDAMPDQKFVVIGSKGDGFPRLGVMIKDLGIEENVEFIGSIENTEVIKWLQRSKAYVQISDTETFGVGIAEAMSCGTPVVVSRQGAIPEVVGDCGLFVDHNEPRSVADGILCILHKSESERNGLGMSSRNRIVRNFSYEGRKNSIRRILESLPGSQGIGRDWRGIRA